MALLQLPLPCLILYCDRRAHNAVINVRRARRAIFVLAIVLSHASAGIPCSKVVTVSSAHTAFIKRRKGEESHRYSTDLSNSCRCRDFDIVSEFY